MGKVQRFVKYLLIVHKGSQHLQTCQHLSVGGPNIIRTDAFMKGFQLSFLRNNKNGTWYFLGPPPLSGRVGAQGTGRYPDVCCMLLCGGSHRAQGRAFESFEYTINNTSVKLRGCSVSL